MSEEKSGGRKHGGENTGTPGKNRWVKQFLPCPVLSEWEYLCTRCVFILKCVYSCARCSQWRLSVDGEREPRDLEGDLEGARCAGGGELGEADLLGLEGRLEEEEEEVSLALGGGEPGAAARGAGEPLWERERERL